jgi:hypothetical protein
MPHLFRASLVAAAVAVLALSGLASAATTQFDFNGNLNASFGPGTLSFAGGTGGAVEWGTAAGFGLPALSGGNAAVLKFPAFNNTQGLLLDTGAAANGGGAGINNYTMFWDILVPDMQAMPTSYMALYNADPNNSNDAEVFIQKSSRGIGTRGAYYGTIQDNTWHRVAITVANSGAFGTVDAFSSIGLYIDGQQQGTVNVVSSDAWTSDQANALGYKRDKYAGLDGRWTLYPTGTGMYTWLLADESNPAETGAGYISSFMFADCVMSAAEIGALGGPTAGGVVPEPSTLVLLAAGLVSLLTYVWRKRK